MDMSQHPNAETAIRYRQDIQQLLVELGDCVTEHESLILDALEDNPRLPSERLRDMCLEAQAQRQYIPYDPRLVEFYIYDDPELNEALIEISELGEEAVNSFKSSIEVLGDTANVTLIKADLFHKYSSQLTADQKASPIETKINAAQAASSSQKGTVKKQNQRAKTESPKRAPNEEKPHSELTECKNSELKTIHDYIKVGVLAGIISIVMSIFLAINAVIDNRSPLSSIYNKWSFVELAVTALLVLGTYHKSRFAASTLFLLFVTNQVLAFSEYRPGASNIILAISFGTAYFFAVIGTFKYHDRRRNRGQSV